MRAIETILNGLGLVPNGKRSVKPIPGYLLAMVPKPTGQNENVKSSGADPERDTVPMMMRYARRQAWQGKKLAQALKGTTREQSVRSIYDFIFNHIQYELDPNGSEQVRSLRRLIADRKGDCDCFANAIANLLLNLDIPFAFRIAKYKSGDDWSHIYVVVPKSGNSLANGYWTIDPVVHRFNYETPFADKKDSSMNLKSLDGLGACNTKDGGKPKLLVMPAAQLKSMGLVNTEKILAEAQVPFTQVVVGGAPAYQVGNRTIAGFVKESDGPALVADLRRQMANDTATAQAETVKDTMPTAKETKAVGIAALALLALAAVANEFKSKPGVNGMGAPRKKIAYYQV